MRRQEQQEGYVLVVVALLLFVFLGFCALAVDMGVANSARTGAQRAADAAALAGVFTFVVDPTSPQPATAQNHATATATQNKIMGDTIAAGDVAVSVDIANHRVTVAVTHAQPAFFARAFGSDSFTVSATGIAEAAISATGTGCLKPFFIPNTALYTAVGIVNQCNACTANPKQILIEKDANGNYQVTNWAKTQITNGTNEFSIKPNDPQQALRPGDFYLIDVPGTNPGGLNSTISQCGSGSSFCGSSYGVLTGDHVGPTNQGIKNLIGCPTNLDTYVSPGVYNRPDGTPTDTSKQLVVCPIWDVCNYTINGQPFCPNATVPGGTQVTLPIVGFALVFVEGLTGGGGGSPGCTGSTAKARLINVAACSGAGGGGGGGGINPNESGPFGVPIRLIRTS